MKKIGICGGTFDPFHNAHLALIGAAVSSGKIDHLLVIPAGIPPHKQKRSVMPAIYRYEMTRRALRDLSGIEISDLEILREGRSFTIDTVKAVKDLFSEPCEIFLIYGSDIVFAIESWYKPAELMKQCKFLLALRGGEDKKAVAAKAKILKEKYGAKIIFFDAPLIELSSSLVREKINEQEQWQQLVPGSVAAFIIDNGIYNFTDEYEQLREVIGSSLSEIEKLLWKFLTRKRLLHSVNVMMYAIHLAIIHKTDLKQTAIAALLHDCAKCLPHDQIAELASKAGDTLLLEEELAHGPAGAVLAAEAFAVKDQAILKAIHYHTTGYGEMTTLDKIIYLADKIELGRTYKDLEPIREAAEYDLDKAMLICISEVETFLRRSKRPSHPYSIDAVKKLQKQPENN